MVKTEHIIVIYLGKHIYEGSINMHTGDKRKSHDVYYCKKCLYSLTVSKI